MRTTERLSAANFKYPVLLLVFSAIPTAGGIARLMSVAGDAARTPDNLRFLEAPTPVVIHAISATLYCLLGAFQFEGVFRRRWPDWHRRAGRLLALTGILAAITGLWMTSVYRIPLPLQGAILYWVRLAVGAAMVACIVIAWVSIVRRQVARHAAYMIRAYALGQGAATQALVLGPWMLITGESGGGTRDLLMTLSWAINVAVAEIVIRRRTLPSTASAQ